MKIYAVYGYFSGWDVQESYFFGAYQTKEQAKKRYLEVVSQKLRDCYNYWIKEIIIDNDENFLIEE